MFESGGFDLNPVELDKVMAVSVGDSIFVAAPILCDPAVDSEPHEVRRIVGNIGRAGMSFLIPPSNPRMKRLNLESYQVINHDPYDGKVEDCFQGTTLHLGFSGYELALDVGDHGGKNRDAFFLESLISAHDHGEWIADLDALATVDSPLLHRARDQKSGCEHSTSDRQRLPESDLVAIDRWEEMLDRPKGAAVVGTHKNWLARFAAAAVRVKMGNHTILLSGNECCKCHKENMELLSAASREMTPISGLEQPSTIYIL